MPAHPHVCRHSLDGRMLQEFQDVPLESLCISFAFIGELDPHLADGITIRAQYPTNGKLKNSRSQTNGKRPEPPEYGSLFLDLMASASRTLIRPGILINPKSGPAFLKTGVNIPIPASRNTKTVIQYARGHDFLAFSDCFKPLKAESCPLFQATQGTRLREHQKKKLRVREGRGFSQTICALLWTKCRFIVTEMVT